MDLDLIIVRSPRPLDSKSQARWTTALAERRRHAPNAAPKITLPGPLPAGSWGDFQGHWTRVSAGTAKMICAALNQKVTAHLFPQSKALLEASEEGVWTPPGELLSVWVLSYWFSGGGGGGRFEQLHRPQTSWAKPGGGVIGAGVTYPRAGVRLRGPPTQEEVCMHGLQVRSRAKLSLQGALYF